MNGIKIPNFRNEDLTLEKAEIEFNAENKKILLKK
jgi:hypothetical protein